MVMSDKISPEILIYVQKIRKFFETNEEASQYFNIDDEGDFYGSVIELAKDNLEKYGDPALNIEQFETLKKKEILKINTSAVFLDLKEYGMISLN